MADDVLPDYLLGLLTTLFCLIIMAYAVYKFDINSILGNIQYERGGDSPLPVMDLLRPAQHMVDVCNPFTLKLSQFRSSSFKDGVYCIMSSLVNSSVQCYWSVDIQHFYRQLRVEASEFNRMVEAAELYQDCAMVGGNIYSKCKDREVRFKVPDSNPEVYKEGLGSLPGSRYPLVVVQYTDSDDGDDNGDSEDEFGQDVPRALALVTVIHVADELGRADSHVIAQFLKLSQSQVVTLKQLYVANNDSNTQNSSEQSPGLCIVCQVSEISRVSIPCRHACLCGECFRKVDSCPMCRAAIESYFVLEQSQNSDLSGEGDTWWERLNNRMNRLFGFR